MNISYVIKLLNVFLAREREERETEIKRMEKNEECAEDNEIFKHTRKII